ncbi:unnamed protein product [Parascedosporium putredinis]|uniref:Large ribosomal subunit protein eL24-related N-terminal domain-containing protein n=1 Tax=Parascedosporium putredinis TaxID=1442378 RepID=A0A9P1GXN9_9PEZI|nr:unnamed protein product [Parascedosporium putredinis]CAI7989225.1 unnamed protein product [Parascedosporium putredinis]
MRIETCYFCSRPAYPSKGITFVRNDAKFKMKRNPRKLKWTKAFRKSAGKEMVVDSTLQFAARRNVPVRYNRDLMAKTLTAMKRVSEIRARRERVFYKKRMAGNKQREIETARELVKTHGHLLPRMRGSERKRLEMEAEGEKMSEDMVDVNKNELRQKQKVRWTVDGEQEVEEEADDNPWEDLGDEDEAMEGIEA